MRALARVKKELAKAKNMKEDGTINVQFALTLVGVFIVAVVGMAVVGALLPQYFSGLENVTDAFENGNTGNEDADALLPIFALLIAFGGLFAIVALVLVVIALKRRG